MGTDQSTATITSSYPSDNLNGGTWTVVIHFSEVADAGSMIQLMTYCAS